MLHLNAGCRCLFALPLLAFLAVLGGQVSRQEAQGQEAAAPSGYRRLAPGVVTTVPPIHSAEDTVSTHNFIEALAVVPDPEFTPYTTSLSSTLKAKATATVFRRPVWNLEFAFKPLRYIYADLPGEDGKLERKLVWYMVYRVRNTGGHLKPVPSPDGRNTVQRVDYSTRFFPQFTLESHEFKKAYIDQVLPVVIDPIRRREDANRPLLNTVEISKVELKPVAEDDQEGGVWGVATWTDIDPQIDFFSIYIKGLTNAYRWEDSKEAYKEGDPIAAGKTLTQKTLQLNFWRPGDEYDPDETEIRFGIPNKVDYTWVYR